MAAYISFQPTDFFNTSIQWSGNDGTQTISGIGFQPDLTWVKAVDDSTPWGSLDSVRGSTKWITPNASTAEQTKSDGITAFNSDGFAIGANGYINDSNYDYRSWNWKVGTTSGIAGSPSITPTAYSFNQTSGCSIIKYTGNSTGGATIPHGLGVAPHMVIVKHLDSGSDFWNVNFPFTSLGSTGRLYLNDTGANSATSAAWNSTVPTSTLITLGSNGEVNASANMICYAFAPVKGYSSFGEYEGNSNVDGPFIYTGFRPAMVIIKNIDRSEPWKIWDNKRSPYNPTENTLNVNDTSVQNTTAVQKLGLYANGFKVRTTSTEINTSTCVYAAFAEHPIVSSNSKAGTAR